MPSLHDTPPYTILTEERCGRLLVAARDILAGEVLFTDAPGAVGPDSNPRPVCLNCYKRLPMLIYRCRHCGIPLCSPHCQDPPGGGHHDRECALLQASGCPRLSVEDFNKPCPWYNAIMVLRVLWLRDNEPETWKLLDILMDHLEVEKPESKRKNFIVDFILNHCRLKQFSEDEIRHIIGILDTNAYIICENPNKDTDLQGLFPTMSILNHSCSSNTICYANEDFSFTCRAVTAIKAGEELTTNYLHHHYHYYGTSYRRPELEDVWHFPCGCGRCGDNTEAGSDIDTIRCHHCVSPGAGVRRDYSDTSDTRWRCECGNTVDHETVRDTLNVNWDMMEQVEKEDIFSLFEILESLKQDFHENHYYVLETKRRIMENIVDYEDLANDLLEKKVTYCRDHLKVQKRIAPGLSEYRANISWHLAEPLYWLTKDRFVQRQITSEELVSTMEEVASHLLMVIQIWGPFRRRSSEWVIAEKARTLLETVDQKYLHRNLGWEAEAVIRDKQLKTYRNMDSI